MSVGVIGLLLRKFLKFGSLKLNSTLFFFSENDSIGNAKIVMTIKYCEYSAGHCKAVIE